MRFPQPRHDDVHLRARLLHRAARRQASDHVENPEAPLHAGVHPVLAEYAGQLPADRGPRLGAGRKLERGRHDTDHGERLAPRGDRHDRPDHVAIHVEVRPPRSVAQHHHALRLGLVLSDRNVRPKDACAPSVSKKGAETALMVNRTGGSS